MTHLLKRYCPSLHASTRFTTTCKKHLQALLPLIQAKGLTILEALKEVFIQVEASDYLCGRIGHDSTGRSTWRAFLGWILRPDKFFDILSGKYAPFTKRTHPSLKAPLPKWTASTFNRMENHNFDLAELEAKERAFQLSQYA